MSGTQRQQRYRSYKAKRAVLQPKYRMKVVGARKGKGSYKREKFRIKDNGY